MKRATKFKETAETHGLISIHALMKRATVSKSYGRKRLDNFNPRPHEEGD